MPDKLPTREEADALLARKALAESMIREWQSKLVDANDELVAVFGTCDATEIEALLKTE